jgi:hypothetical protein
MNMTVTYRFSSLAAMADYYANKARELRESADAGRGRKIDQASKRGEAFAFEMVADQLRRTTIEETKL